MLWKEIVQRGFPGRYTTVRQVIGTWRQEQPQRRCRGPKPRNTTVLSRTKVPSPRQVSWWLLYGVGRPSDATTRTYRQVFLDALCQHCADLSHAHTLANDFRLMVKHRSANQLRPWIEQACACGLQEFNAFAKSLSQDLAAVTAALKLPWSNGQVEGQINRLKLIKRQMFGRASFELLRARVLHAA
jgi:transposase